MAAVLEAIRCPHDGAELLDEHARARHMWDVHTEPLGYFCPAPGCIKRFYTDAKRDAHVEAEHDAPDVAADLIQPPPAAQPKEAAVAAAKQCPIKGCDRPARHTGRHRGQSARARTETPERGDRGAESPEKPAPRPVPVDPEPEVPEDSMGTLDSDAFDEVIVFVRKDLAGDVAEMVEGVIDGYGKAEDPASARRLAGLLGLWAALVEATA